MKTATVKAYGKINISLNVLGVSNGYHNLDSIVVTVDKFDKITVTKRKDDKILLNLYGEYGNKPFVQENFNAYKAAKAFKEKYNTCGVTVDVDRNIPEGGGMGASSADIAGVLNAMKKLFCVTDSVKDLADSLGSDSGYLLGGGFARLTSRGEVVERLTDVEYKPYFLVIYAKNGVNTAKCFKEFDDSGDSGTVADNDAIIEGLRKCDILSVKGKTGNALTDSAIKINGEVGDNLKALLSLSPDVCGMTGSGSTVFSMYDSYEMVTWAYSKLKRKYGAKIEMLDTYNPYYKSPIKSFLERFSIFDKNE